MSSSTKGNNNNSASSQNQASHPHKYRKGMGSTRFVSDAAVNLQSEQIDYSHFAVENPVNITEQHGSSNSEDDDDEEDDDSGDEDFSHQHHAAMNLLGIRRWDVKDQGDNGSNLAPTNTNITISNTSNQSNNGAHQPASSNTSGGTQPVSMNDLKGDFSITKIYEPKFMQVFHNYCESMKQQIDISKHLMSVCLENLIPFSCWARESNNRCQQIKNALDDNVDLRPEVRNGLSMILIYCLSSAQARQTKDGDMFSVLQDSEKGLGIVNKTSLKIYNDPFNYFTFLKSCMSGLIDAGKIPENERQNQPKKPKRQSENKEEIYAFVQLKNLLVSMLNEGHNTVARTKVQQIMNIWQHRQKNIRNRRFATALAVVSTLSNLKQKVTSNFPAQPGVMRGFDESSLLAAATGYNPASGLLEKQSNTGLKSLVAIGSEAFEIEGASLISPQAVSGKSNNASRKSGGSLSLPNTDLNSMGIDNILHIPAVNASSVANLPGGVGYSTTAASSDIVSFHHGKDLLGEIRGTGAVAHTNSKYNRLSTRSFPCIPALRFERVGGKEWEFKENKVYNIESLVGNVNSVFCLLDETKLSHEERKTKRFISHHNGFVSLQAELQHRGALLTSWPKFDHSHMLDFLECWLNQEQDITLLDFWKLSSVSSHGTPGIDSHSTNSSSIPRGLGIIAYEVVMQVGVVLRKNEALGIKEDCWRLIYPLDLQCETMSTSFGSFLISFFPQLRNILNRLSMEDLKNIIVKYYPHKIEPPVMQPPRSDPSIAYQTIGTLDEHTALVISRFENNLAFHDITLQVS